MSSSDSLSTVESLPSGIQDDGQGNRFVGGTVRSDGTVRKVYKVRPGFVPTEDVPKYVPVGRRRLQEGAVPGDSQDRKSTTSTRLSPHLANINKILQSRDGEEAGAGRVRNQPLNKQQARQSDPSFVTRKNNTNDTHLLKTDLEFPSLAPKPKPQQSKADSNDLAASLSRLTIKSSDTDAKECVLKDMSKSAEPPKAISDAKTNSSDPASRPKYIPPWKRQ